MKKLLVLFMISLLFCGCGDKYKDYKHYELKDDETIKYTVHYDDGEANYVIADITPKDSNSLFYGIFYQVSDNDYILLDEIDTNHSMEDTAKFYNDKLYVLSNGGHYCYVYNLKYEKFEKKELDFEFNGFIPNTIQDIKDNMIYFSGQDYNNDFLNSSRGGTLYYKCSLQDNKCETTEYNN